MTSLAQSGLPELPQHHQRGDLKVDDVELVDESPFPNEPLDLLVERAVARELAFELLERRGPSPDALTAGSALK